MLPVEIEPSHKNDAVNAHSPFLFDHASGVFRELFARGRFLATVFGVEELLGFGKADADETDADGDSGSDPENSLQSFVSSSFFGFRRMVELTFQDSTLPPTPKLAQAASTYPRL